VTLMVIVPVVEGQGEVQAVPNLLHRIVTAAAPGMALRVSAPIRVKAGSFLQDDEYFRRHILLAGAKAAQSQGHVLILLDCEDDCPARLGSALLQRAGEVRSDVSVIVCLAHREYETWFLTAALSLRGCCGLSHQLTPPADPEAHRGAKEWLSRHMPYPYDPVQHQLDLTRAMNLEQAQQNQSFRRFVRKISETLPGNA
jgi:hypothetical protein